MTIEYLKTTEVAKLIRKELRKQYPHTKFQVKTSKSYGSVNVNYWDSVPEREVSTLLSKYKKNITVDGVEFATHLDYITVIRHFSENFITEIIDFVKETYNSYDDDVRIQKYSIEDPKYGYKAWFSGNYDAINKYRIIANEYSALRSVKEQFQEKNKPTKTVEEKTSQEIFEDYFEDNKNVPTINPRQLKIDGSIEFNAQFPDFNKQMDFEAYKEQWLLGEVEQETTEIRIEEVWQFSLRDFEVFKKSLLIDFDFLHKKGGVFQAAEGTYGRRCVAIFCPEAEGDKIFVVDPQGFSYARYAGLMLAVEQKELINLIANDIQFKQEDLEYPVIDECQAFSKPISHTVGNVIYANFGAK